MEALWTIAELGEQVAAVLAELDYEGALSKRVRAVPDARTIRYYTTIGLLDRPAEMRGRTAYYGRRHLMQVVAIKRLQAEGLALAQIQERMAGLPTQSLEKIAGISAPAKERKKVTRKFWTEPPSAPAFVQAVELAEGLTLLIERNKPLNTKQQDAVRDAAAQLVSKLGAL